MTSATLGPVEADVRSEMYPSAGRPGDVLDHIGERGDVVVPLGNGEPVAVLDALEDAGREGALRDVRVHQMHCLRDRDYLHGEVRGLRHVSYFLSQETRAAFAAGHLDLVPNHFSEVPLLLRRMRPDLVIAAVSPPDEHGWVSMGVAADYAASLIGDVPFFVEVNARMPRTQGSNRLRLSDVAGWCESDHPLVEVPPVAPGPTERRIAGLIAERIPDAATIQAGIGGVPNALLAALHGHRDLTVHTELFADGFADLVESGAVTNAASLIDGCAVTTFALGSRALHRWVDGREDLSFQPVDWVNDPRVVGSIPDFVSINATTEVDLYGQCASETVAGRYYSSSGGQADFARGAMYSEGGMNFIVLPSTARGGTVSRIRVTLTPGSVVTTLKNTIDHVVTEHGVAELRGQPISERVRRLIAIADPAFRERLTREAAAIGMLR
jgi:acyl-CoA hydrolase